MTPAEQIRLSRLVRETAKDHPDHDFIQLIDAVYARLTPGSFPTWSESHAKYLQAAAMIAYQNQEILT